MKNKNIGIIGHTSVTDFSLKAKKVSDSNTEERYKLKGVLGKLCYRSVCDNDEALYYNKSTKKHYCRSCASIINDANRADAYRFYGTELCQLSKEVDKDGKYPINPESELMDDAGLDYKDNMRSMTDNLSGMTKNERFNFGKAKPVKSTNVIGRNDKCPCGSGNKYKTCCINKT